MLSLFLFKGYFNVTNKSNKYHNATICGIANMILRGVTWSFSGTIVLSVARLNTININIVIVLVV